MAPPEDEARGCLGIVSGAWLNRVILALIVGLVALGILRARHNRRRR